jgi:hypothetical protein
MGHLARRDEQAPTMGQPHHPAVNAATECIAHLIATCHDGKRRVKAPDVPTGPWPGGVSACFSGENKGGAGTSPAPLKSYLFFFAVLRRAVPVFFAVDFFAAAVLRFAGFFLFTAAMMSLLRAGWLINSL